MANMGKAELSVLPDASRRWGSLGADLDPLGRLPPFRHPELDEAQRRGGASQETAPLESVYCGPIGADFMRLPFPERCRFILEAMETTTPPVDPPPPARRPAASPLFRRFPPA